MKAIRVLLVDDQRMVGEAVRRMVATEADLSYDYCQKPEEAVAQLHEVARRFGKQAFELRVCHVIGGEAEPLCAVTANLDQAVQGVSFGSRGH